MGTNQYKAFGTGGSANTLSYAAYSALTTLIANGFQSGIANSTQMNTVWRQATVAAAGTAKFAVDNGTLDCLDDGSIANFALAIKDAVQAMINASAVVPTGTVAAFAMTAAPTGWLKCNGATVSRTTYAALFAKIGTTYGAGNGTTTFHLPDFRGQFIRGLDDGAGVDSGRTLDVAQADAFKLHQHLFNADDTATVGGYTSYGSAPRGNVNDAVGPADWLTKSDPTGGPVGGTETRPKNWALLLCIKT